MAVRERRGGFYSAIFRDSVVLLFANVQGLATRKWERDHEWKLRILIREVNQLGAFYGLSSAGLFCAFGLGAAYERMACSAMPSASGIKVK